MMGETFALLYIIMKKNSFITLHMLKIMMFIHNIKMNYRKFITIK